MKLSAALQNGLTKIHKVWYIIRSYHEGSGTGTIYYCHSLTLNNQHLTVTQCHGYVASWLGRVPVQFYPGETTQLQVKNELLIPTALSSSVSRNQTIFTSVLVGVGALRFEWVPTVKLPHGAEAVNAKI